MKNPYKNQDIFACRYQAHSKFSYRVSVFHVLKAKKCYPQGCIYFKWSCRLLAKGQRCVRKFTHVGRLCQGCKHYEDEKVHLVPILQISEDDYTAFLEEVEEFDDWIESMRHRDVDFYCVVDSIKPRFRKEVMGAKGQFRLNGYVVVARYGFIDRSEFDDLFYVNVSPVQQERERIAPGDRFDACGQVLLDRGRVVISRVRRIEFQERSRKPTWRNSEALVARQVATRFARQTDTCLGCPKGALVDVSETRNGVVQHWRELYCLAGVADPRECYLYSLEKFPQCARPL
ncbi:hypothetical protein JW992_16565 [candidate division KSB1 bacterium]|nr:hypothetical protein [candidate division KSB1 bacterium]